MNHDMLVVTDRMAKAIVTAMALHGFLASCIAELQQKLNDETFPCESNFDCSIISGHSSRKIFCGYKLNTLLRLRTFCCELCHLHKNVPRTGILAAPLDLPASCVTRHAYPALPDSQQVFCPASLGFQAVVLVLDFQLLPSLLVSFFF